MELAPRNLAFLLLCCCPAWAANPQPAPTLRWAEGAPGCTLRWAQDGRTYYGISAQNIVVTVAVDNQELEKVRHRTIPAISVLLSIDYKGTQPLAVAPSQSTLEFVKHFQVVQRALHPDAMLKQLQQSIDAVTDEISHHQVKKHPEQKDAKEAELQQRLKDYTEMMDFISTRAIHDGAVDASIPSASGWAFFSTRNRWIGRWRRPEQFVLRIPLDKAVWEFPFELPPKGGKVELRPRQQ